MFSNARVLVRYHLRVNSLYRYPVKGLSAERLSTVSLAPDCGIPGDRRFAIVHAGSQCDELNPEWMHRRNFVVRAHSPGVAALATMFDPDSRVLVVQSVEQRCELQVDSASVNDDLTDYYNHSPQRSSPGLSVLPNFPMAV